MCDCDRTVFSRRHLLAGLTAGLGATLLSRAASAAPLGCFDAAALAGQPGEADRRPPTPADAVVTPPPASPGPAVTGALAGIVRRVDLPAGEKAVALTFDLCQTKSPIAGYDGAVVDCLRSNRVPATFFPAGRWLLTHRERAEQLAADPLFVLGNHSFDHPDLHSATADRVTSEILTTETALAETRARAGTTCGVALAAPMRLFRFPYGSCAENGAAVANALGSVVIQWDTVSGDPDGPSARDIESNVMRTIKPGSIVVMHANGRGTHTAEALASIIPKLKAKGYRFVTVPELIAMGTPKAATECYITKPGDTLRYDEGLAHKAPGKTLPVLPAT
jgi:peptidoglycan/xylan/chitin deacetylase (PgdA/CDA1 family)